MNVFLDHLPDFGRGVLTTIELTVLSFTGAMLVALVVVSCRVSPVKPLRAFAIAYVEVFQNIPLLLWLILIIFALPEIAINFDLFLCAVLALSLYSAAYYAEALRSGINSVPKGQAEAARALGLGFLRTQSSVVLPQALRSVLQPLCNITIGLLMNTALTAGTGLFELTAAANAVNVITSDPLPVYIGAGVVYGLLALLISLVTSRLEKKLVIHR
ncbi:amino acid ABC transporter permease [Amycolatopsis magusensis]|uniref:Glutamate transport system permease protein n=2 Tax=Amycolatopsis magusensis TaxID=882444 RepID=A0ABS4PI55_9PSEU|nr:amino acid ABC transporter permease [Amycolatopsis magusensis]MBP2179070.1 glutamate transport system permease protein [Amycolatopsis magusensis]